MIAVVGALDQEIQNFLAHLQGSSTIQRGPFTVHRGQLANREVVITRSGVGKVLAAMVTQMIIDAYSPSHLIFTGIAGALNPDLGIGDLVISRDCMQHDMDARATGFARGEVPYTGIRVVAADPGLIEAAQKVRGLKGKSLVGRILSGDQFITDSARDSHRFLRDELRGDAIEMEGAAVGFVCSLHQVPFVILRTISDRADHSAAVDYESFLPVASEQSYEAVSQMLSTMKDGKS